METITFERDLLVRHDPEIDDADEALDVPVFRELNEDNPFLTRASEAPLHRITLAPSLHYADMTLANRTLAGFKLDTCSLSIRNCKVANWQSLALRIAFCPNLTKLEIIDSSFPDSELGAVTSSGQLRWLVLGTMLGLLQTAT